MSEVTEVNNTMEYKSTEDNTAAVKTADAGKKKKKSFFKKHPIGGAIAAMGLTWLFGTVLTIIPVVMTMAKGNDPKNMTQQEYLPCIILEAVIVLLFYCKVSKKQLKDFFSPAGTGRGILMGWSVLIFVIVGAIISLTDGMVVGNAASSIALALVAGIGEELLFRLVPLNVVMDANAGRRTTVIGCVVTSVIFGLAHSTNLLRGADPTATLLQVIYAAGIGLLFAGIYVKTKSIWVTMILHTFVDFMSFILVTDPTQQVTGVLSQAMSTRDVIITVIGTVIYFINAIMVLRTISDTKPAE